MAKINETCTAIIKIMLLCLSFYTVQKQDIRQWENKRGNLVQITNWNCISWNSYIIIYLNGEKLNRYFYLGTVTCSLVTCECYF